MKKQNIYNCLYCNYWMNSEIIESKNKRKNSIVKKVCKKTNKVINCESESCKFFEPADFFYCDNLNCRKYVEACIYGHRYSIHGKYPNLYDKCSKCFQYDKYISVLEENFTYIIKQIVKIKRRNKPFTLKRRNKPFTLKRRNKPFTLKRREIEIKLKRRSKQIILRRRK